MSTRKTKIGASRLIAKELQLERSSTERTLYFHGESMRPFLVEGDEVVVEPVTWSSIREGDVITYRHLDRFPTRRVVKKTDENLVLWCENWVDRIYHANREDVLGRATARRRGDDWLTASSLAWKRARLTAMLKWELRNARRVVLPETIARARRAPGKVLRVLGLLPPPREK